MLLAMLLKLSCLKCFTFQIPSYIKLLLSAKFKLLYQGSLSDFDDLDKEVTSVVSNAQNIEEQTEHIREIIDNYIKNFFDGDKFRNIPQDHENQNNIKSISTQWHMLKIYLNNMSEETK